MSSVINALFKQHGILPMPLCFIHNAREISCKSLNSVFLLVNWKPSSAFKSECCVRWSKAFQKSMYTAFTALPLTAKAVILSQGEIRLVEHDLLFVNPCWLLLIDLFYIFWNQLQGFTIYSLCLSCYLRWLPDFLLKQNKPKNHSEWFWLSFESLLEIFVNSLDSALLTVCLLFLTELQYVSRLFFQKAMFALPV